jgi:hypothetical protein
MFGRVMLAILIYSRWERFCMWNCICVKKSFECAVFKFSYDISGWVLIPIHSVYVKCRTREVSSWYRPCPCMSCSFLTDFPFHC